MPAQALWDAEGWGYRPGRFHLPCWREGKALREKGTQQLTKATKS